MLRPTIIMFAVLIMALAYVATAESIYGYPVGTVGFTLITIEGLLLGLLSVSVFSGKRARSNRTSYLALLTVISILFSATIRLSQLSAAAWILPAFFTVDVGIFIVVTGAYSWLLTEARQPS